MHLAKLLVHSAAPSSAPPVRAAPARMLPSPAPRVSLIIPTRDGAEVLATCIRSIRARTRYDDYEIIIVDNGSVQERTKQLFAELRADPAIRILSRPEPFNFSRLNNAAAREATGTILGLVNNDIEVTHGEWLAEMVALAVAPDDRLRRRKAALSRRTHPACRRRGRARRRCRACAPLRARRRSGLPRPAAPRARRQRRHGGLPR